MGLHNVSGAHLRPVLLLQAADAGDQMLRLHELRAVGDACDGMQRDVRQVAWVGDCAEAPPGKPDISSCIDLHDAQRQLCMLSLSTWATALCRMHIRGTTFQNRAGLELRNSLLHTRAA